MKLPDKDIRAAVFTALKGSVAVPIRDMVAWPNDDEPYVILANQDNFDDSPKCGFGDIHSMLIQVYGKQQTIVSRAEIESIATVITEEIIKQKSIDFISGGASWQIVDIRLNSTNDDVVFTGDKISARKNIIINFTLRQTS